MSSAIRRVVTGHDSAGKSCVMIDAPLSAVTVPHDRLAWTSGAMPADATANADAALVPHRLEPRVGGSIFRVVEFPPAKVMAGFTAEQKEAFFRELFGGMSAAHCRVDTTRGPGMHRTASLDYVVVLRGEIVLMLDAGEVTLGPGDLVVQRATNHDWMVPGDEPAMLAVVMIHAPDGHRI